MDFRWKHGSRLLVGLILLTGALYFPPSARAAGFGSVQGEVVEAGTDLVVQGARVQLRPVGAGDTLETQTDERGQFRFPAVEPRPYTLGVEADHYYAADYESPGQAPRTAVAERGACVPGNNH